MIDFKKNFSNIKKQKKDIKLVKISIFFKKRKNIRKMRMFLYLNFIIRS